MDEFEIWPIRIPLLAFSPGVERVVSKNTNELKTGSPGRFGLDVSTLGSPMGAPVPSIYSSASPWVGSQPCGAKYPGFCADSKGV